MSPAVGAAGLPFAAIVPASQYTNAGMIEKIVPMIAKNQRPDHRLADLELGQLRS